LLFILVGWLSLVGVMAAYQEFRKGGWGKMDWKVRALVMSFPFLYPLLLIVYVFVYGAAVIVAPLAGLLKGAARLVRRTRR
jgi:hypothetical protein